jgi:hypothetical protein
MIMKHKSAERQLKITNESIARTREKLDAYADTVSVVKSLVLRYNIHSV